MSAKRPNTPTESLEASLTQMQLIRQGKLPKKTWNELYAELKFESGWERMKQITEHAMDEGNLEDVRVDLRVEREKVKTI